MSSTRLLERTNSVKAGKGMYSTSALSMASNLGFLFGTGADSPNERKLVVGEIAVGGLSPLEKAVKESRSSYKKVVLAQATVGIKVDGIDTNLAVMKEFRSPVVELGSWLLSLIYWEDSLKSSLFCLVFTYIIWRVWLGYAFALLLIFFAIFMVITRYCNQGGPVDELKVIAPPARNTMEQLPAVQNAISQAEELIQDANIVLLKFHALIFSIFPQASEKFAIALLVTALFLAFVPSKYILLLVFLERFTMYSPLRRASTKRWMRRLREWWFSIPAAPVSLQRVKDEKKRK